jgi:hypothetical protein
VGCSHRGPGGAGCSGRTQDLLAANVSAPEALTSGSQRPLLACSIFGLAAAAVAALATSTRGNPAMVPEPRSMQSVA